MLDNFFSLNGQFVTMSNPVALAIHFRTSSSLENTLYQPSSIAVGQRTLFKGKKFKNVSFSKTLFRRMTFTDCEFEDCLFIGARFSEVQFHRCKFVNCNFYKCPLSKCYLDPNCFSFSPSLQKDSCKCYDRVISQFACQCQVRKPTSPCGRCRNHVSKMASVAAIIRTENKQDKPFRFAKEWMVNKAGDCIFGIRVSALKICHI